MLKNFASSDLLGEPSKILPQILILFLAGKILKQTFHHNIKILISDRIDSITEESIDKLVEEENSFLGSFLFMLNKGFQFTK